MIRNLNNNSPGIDNLKAEIIKHVAHIISGPLSKIINYSFKHGCFPDSLKKAVVIPVYKAKSKHETKNFRPISLLTTLSKIFENAMYSRLYQFVSENNILYPDQFGFRAKHSTDQALTKILGTILDAWENK